MQKMSGSTKDKRVQKLLKQYSTINWERLDWLTSHAEAQLAEALSAKNRLDVFVQMAHCGLIYRLRGAALIANTQENGWRTFEKGVAYTAHSLLETPGIDAEALGHVIAHTTLLGWASLAEQLLVRFRRITEQRERDWGSYHFLQFAVLQASRLLDMPAPQSFSSELGIYERVEKELSRGTVAEASLRAILDYHLDTSSLAHARLRQFSGHYDLIPIEYFLLSAVIAKTGASPISRDHPIFGTPFDRSPSPADAFLLAEDACLRNLLLRG